MKSIFKQVSAGLTDNVGEKAREQCEQKSIPARKRYIVRG